MHSETEVAETPTSSETRPPWRMRVRRSRPRVSVPSQCAPEGRDGPRAVRRGEARDERSVERDAPARAVLGGAAGAHLAREVGRPVDGGDADGVAVVHLDEDVGALDAEDA